MTAHLSQQVRRAAQIAPRGIATICGSRQRTWSEVRARVERLAGGLASLGVAPGDRVAALATNSDRYFELFFAVFHLGAVLVPINMRLAPAEVDFRLEDSGARLFCLDSDNFFMLEALAPERRAALADVVALETPEETPPGLVSSEALIAEASPAKDGDAGGEDLAMIVYTGGSTGRAKGVMLSHTNLYSNGMSALQGVGYGKDSVYLHAGPMSHMADGMAIFGVTLAAATHVFLPRFTVEDCLERIETARITHLCVVPTMVEMIAQGAEQARRDTSSLVQIQFGSSPMPEGTLRRALALWPNILFLHGYGMTELSPLITLAPFHLRRPDVAGDRLRSCGVAVPTVEIRIVDGEGNEVPAGEVGELIVRGSHVMLGYWNMPEATKKAVRNGWMHTEDAAWMDEEGLVYVVDRLKDMIISGGENIYSTEVENALTRTEGIQQAAVIGVPHETWGEAVHAVVVLSAGAALTEADVIAACRKEIARYKCPKTVEFRDGDLPVTGAGKIDKKALREEARQKTPR